MPPSFINLCLLTLHHCETLQWYSWRWLCDGHITTWASELPERFSWEQRGTELYSDFISCHCVSGVCASHVPIWIAQLFMGIFQMMILKAESLWFLICLFFHSHLPYHFAHLGSTWEWEFSRGTHPLSDSIFSLPNSDSDFSRRRNASLGFHAFPWPLWVLINGNDLLGTALTHSSA